MPTKQHTKPSGTDESIQEAEIVEETKTADEKPVVEEVKTTVAEETPIVNEYVPEVKYREVVYLGVADICERTGAVTGNRYSFTKDTYGMPQATYVDERDYPAIISEKGRGCARRDPALLFMSKLEWDLELQQARIANNS